MRTEVPANPRPTSKSWELVPVFCMAFMGIYCLPEGFLLLRGKTSPRVGHEMPDAARTPAVSVAVPNQATPAAKGDAQENSALFRIYSESKDFRSQDALSKTSENGDHREPIPGLPRPIRSRLLASAKGLGGVNAAFLAYESWGSFTGVRDSLREDFEREGWQRNHRFEKLASDQLPGRLLSYTRGSERCLISVERVSETGKVETLLLYVDKRWLPEGGGTM